MTSKTGKKTFDLNTYKLFTSVHQSPWETTNKVVFNSSPSDLGHTSDSMHRGSKPCLYFCIMNYIWIMICFQIWGDNTYQQKRDLYNFLATCKMQIFVPKLAKSTKGEASGMVFPTRVTLCSPHSLLRENCEGSHGVCRYHIRDCFAIVTHHVIPCNAGHEIPVLSGALETRKTVKFIHMEVA